MFIKSLALLSLALICCPNQCVADSPSSDALRNLYNSITWGVATNGVQIGIRRVYSAGDTRIPLSVHLCNTNSALCYGLLFPPQGHRLNLTLLDASGKEVSKTKEGDAICHAVTPAVIAQLKAERRAFSLFSGSPYQYSKLDLLDCFRVNDPGTYTLTVRAEIFKLAAYPAIDRWTLPPTSLKIAITKDDIENSKSKSAPTQ